MRTGADMEALESNRRKTERFLLVDGSNLLFQMFFGMPARIVNAQGKAIQGVLGFSGALLKIIRQTYPSHIVVVFDGAHENKRLYIDKDYKANRLDYSEVREDENPFSQIEDVISSFDSDFFQLITDKVSVLRYRGKNTIIYTPEQIKEKFGIAPELYADWKSLTGDAADNIKGADKIGPKTATSLIREFGTLENVLASMEKIKKPSVRESLMQSAEKLRTNYRLIKLENRIPLPFILKELKYTDSGLATTEVMRGIGLK